MKLLLFMSTLLTLWSCSQQPQNVDELVEYVNSPAISDWVCKEDIERARKDIENGKLTFTQTAGFLFGFIRYEKELSSLCEQHGLQFDYDMLGCTVEDGQTQGCYGAYMENELIKRFGKNFKQGLHETADSLFLVNIHVNKLFVNSWDCDVLPKQMTEFKNTINSGQLEIRKSTDEYGGWPFHDLEFVIELDSTISAFNSSNFVPMDSANLEYEQPLFDLATNYLKQEYPLWVPGTIKSIPVRTKHNVRIVFEKK